MPDRDDFRTTVAHRLDEARDAASRAYDRTRENARNAYDGARESAERALVSTRDGARDAARKTFAGIEQNPLSVLVGGVALGVLASAVIPRSKQEKKLLKPVGKRLAEGAAFAAVAARDAGKRELDARGLTRDAARQQAKQLFDGVVQAASNAGQAAATASTKKPTSRRRAAK